MGDVPAPPGHLTQLLQRWQAGDAGSLDQLVTDVYPELRSMASRYMRGGRGSTIQATMLVHDLYVRLLKQERANFPNRRAFFGFASGVMRHILIDHIRQGQAEKRGACLPDHPLLALVCHQHGSNAQQRPQHRVACLHEEGIAERMRVPGDVAEVVGKAQPDGIECNESGKRQHAHRQH